MYDKDRVNCKDCTEFKRRQGLKPDCKECRVDLLPENNVIDYLIYWYGPTFVDGMGGISLPSIKEALESEDIDNRPLVTKKLIVYLRVALDAQNKEHTDGGKNNKT